MLINNLPSSFDEMKNKAREFINYFAVMFAVFLILIAMAPFVDPMRENLQLF